jgi:subtilisin family serine protease
MLPVSPEEVRQSTAKGVRILVVDSGVEVTHPALSDRSFRCWRVLPGPDGYHQVVEDPSGVDVFGHGTAVAAILCEFAPGASIESLRVLGGDLRATSHLVLAGLHWAIDQGFDVVNCSFGSSNNQFLPDYKSAVDRAFCRNSLLVSACNNFDFQKLEYPGSFPTVISSDFGKLDGLDLLRRPGHLVEFVARGDEIRVAWKDGSFRQSTGSSFAAPHVAAIVARIRQLRPQWNACEMKTALYELSAIQRVGG